MTLLIAGCASLMQAQASYRIDYARHFFATPEVERAARAGLMEKLGALQRFKGHLADSSATLLQGLQLRDAMTLEYRKHDAYLYLLSCDDTANESLLADERRLSALVGEQTAFFDNELLGVDPSRFKTWEEQQPALRQYEFQFDTAVRVRSHRLSADQEAMLQLLAPETLQWQGDLFDKLADLSRVAQNGARTHQQSFVQLHAELDRNAPLYAFALDRLITAANQSAKLHKFADAAEQAYDDRFLSKSVVGDLLARLATDAQVFKDYEQMRVDHFKAQAGVQEVGPWDLPQPRAPGRRFSLADTRSLLSHALAPLGADYLHEVDALLDPQNGRVDAGSAGRRKATGFSKGSAGFPSVLYIGRFDGSYDSVRAVTHEAAHAVHRQLMNSVLPAYAEGPHFLFESFAEFNELLLADYLYRTAASREERQFYLEQFFEGKGMEMFRDAPEAALEQALYERKAAGGAFSVDTLGEVTSDIYSRYSIWPARIPQLRHLWMEIPLMYEDPFYDLNYVHASVLALKYFQMAKSNPSDFQRRYIALLKNGFDAPPADLLRRFLGIEINDPALLQGDVAVLREKLEELRSLYGGSDSAALPRSTVQTLPDPESDRQ